MIKIDLPYEAADEILLANLYDGFASCYASHQEDVRMYKSDSQLYDYKFDDIVESKSILCAFEMILKYYTPKGDKVVPSKLQAIRDRIDCKDKIATGMSRMTK
jgi:hypothetical protein